MLKAALTGNGIPSISEENIKSIRTPLIAILCLACIVPLLILWGVVSYQSHRMTATASEESLKLAYADLDHILGGVLGMLRVSGSSTDEKSLRAEIMGIKVGDSGYVYVLDASGHYVVSQGGKRDGELIWGAKDSNGNLFIQEIIGKALALKQGEIGEERYPWKNAGDPAPRMKVARIGYYPARGWIIGVGSYLDEFMAAPTRIVRISASSDRAILLTLLAALAAAVAIAFIFSAAFIVKPIMRTAELFAAIAEDEGDLSHRLPAKGKDEIGRMSDSFNAFMDKLEAIVASIRNAGGALGSAGAKLDESIASTVAAVAQIATSAQRVNDQVHRQAAGVSESTGEVERISSTLAVFDSKIETQSESISESSASVEEMVANIESVANNVERMGSSFEILLSASESGR